MKPLTIVSGGFSFILRLKVPALEIDEERRLGDMSRVRRFFRESFPSAESALEGAAFTLSTRVIYKEHQGWKYVLLCSWAQGESIAAALSTAEAAQKRIRAERAAYWSAIRSS